jgi:hypothetical protein
MLFAESAARIVLTSNICPFILPTSIRGDLSLDYFNSAELQRPLERGSEGMNS